MSPFWRTHLKRGVFSLQRAPHFDEVVVSFQELEFAIRVTYLSTVEHVARCNIAEKRRSLRQPVC